MDSLSMIKPLFEPHFKSIFDNEVEDNVEYLSDQPAEQLEIQADEIIDVGPNSSIPFQTIIVPSHDITEIEIYSITAKLAYKGKPTSPNYHLLTGVDFGVYIIQITTKDKKTATGRIIHMQNFSAPVDPEDLITKIIFKTEKEILIEAGAPQSVNKRGIVSSEEGVNVRETADPKGNIIALIPFNTHVLVHTQESDWYFIESKVGVSGYVPVSRIKTNMPDPDAYLYKILPGEMPEHIAKKFQSNYSTEGLNDWETVLLTLIRYNGGLGDATKGLYADKKDVNSLTVSESAHSKANYFIWIPTEISSKGSSHTYFGGDAVKSIEITSLWSPKEKGDAVLKYLGLKNYKAIIEVFRTAETTDEFVRIQKVVEETMTMAVVFQQINDEWTSILIGSIGPVLSGHDYLNTARAAFIIEYSTSGYPEFVSETFALFILSTCYDDDVKSVLSQIDGDNRLPGTIMKMENVKAMLTDRGISLDEYKKDDVGMAQGAGEGLANSFAPDIGVLKWSMSMDYLPPLFYNAIRQSQWGVISDSIGNPVNWVDYLMLNIPSTIYGTGSALVSGISSLAEGQYEDAGRELVGPALLVLSLFGLRSSPKSQTVYSPPGPNAFIIPKFEGPVPAEVSRLITVMQLGADASSVFANLYKTIGKQGIIDVSVYARKNIQNTLFLQKNGPAGAEALWKAGGDLALAEATLVTTYKGLPIPKSNISINLTHIFDGEVINSKAKGFHYVEESLFNPDGTATNASGTARITKVTLQPNALGIFEAEIEVYNPRSSQVPWRNKTSSFFPKTWSRPRVIREINEAYNNRVFDGANNIWIGTSKSGMKIHMYIDQAGFDVNTAYPPYYQN